MQMIDDLATISSDIKYDLVSGQFHFFGDVFGAIDDLRDQTLVIILQMRNRVHMLLGNHQNMNRRRWMNVLERFDFSVFKDRVRWYLTRSNFAKDTVSHNPTFLLDSSTIYRILFYVQESYHLKDPKFPME